MHAQVHNSVTIWFHWMPGRSLSRRETIATDFDNSEPAIVDEWDMEELNGDSVWWKSRSSAASFLPSIYMQYTYLSRTPGTCRFTGTGPQPIPESVVNMEPDWLLVQFTCWSRLPFTRVLREPSSYNFDLFASATLHCSMLYNSLFVAQTARACVALVQK